MPNDMGDILLKYKLLNKTARQEVSDFIDFLLSKKPLSSYKKKILKVSTWSESDLNSFNAMQIKSYSLFFKV